MVWDEVCLPQILVIVIFFSFGSFHHSKVVDSFDSSEEKQKR